MPTAFNSLNSSAKGGIGEMEVADIVFKIVPETEWRQAQLTGSYDGSADDLRDGFIHLSFADQIEGTAARHFKGRTGLLLVAFRSDTLGEALKLERSRGGALFPHLFSRLPVDLALWERPMELRDDGVPHVTGDLT